MPAIVLKSRFRIIGKDKRSYSTYIQYMDRKEAKSIEKEMKETNKLVEEKNKTLGESTIKYLSDWQKTDNVFNDKEDAMTPESIAKTEKSFNIAEQNKTPLWQLVYSFDNEFLKENGFLLNNGTLNDTAIKNATRKSMSHLLEKEQFNDTTVWTAAIHYNTDNIHVHVALVEEVSSREKIKKGRYKGEYKGKIPKTRIKEMKSIFINQLIDRKHEMNRVNGLMREELNQALKQTNLYQELELKNEIEQLILKLPENKNLWQYNRKETQPFRGDIDKISQQFINSLQKDSFNELIKKIQEEHAFRNKVYGQSENNYFENKMTELYTMLGNSILNQLKDYQNESFKQLELTKEIDSHNRAEALEQALNDFKNIDLGSNKLNAHHSIIHFNNNLIFDREVQKLINNALQSQYEKFNQQDPQTVATMIQLARDLNKQKNKLEKKAKNKLITSSERREFLEKIEQTLVETELLTNRQLDKKDLEMIADIKQELNPELDKTINQINQQLNQYRIEESRGQQNNKEIRNIQDNVRRINRYNAKHLNQYDPYNHLNLLTNMDNNLKDLYRLGNNDDVDRIKRSLSFQINKQSKLAKDNIKKYSSSSIQKSMKDFINKVIDNFNNDRPRFLAQLEQEREETRKILDEERQQENQRNRSY
ncbi:MobP2 family relaxase [Hutsoniella sourekii]|uniref:MobP2 family relaxase n=1 Tax=Hutsoniella sourekii TaxID=87650 RepID=UPI000487B05D|nr:MobP2 family relaxase [Hutsoniella sourekii]